MRPRKPRWVMPRRTPERAGRAPLRCRTGSSSIPSRRSVQGRRRPRRWSWTGGGEARGRAAWLTRLDHHDLFPGDHTGRRQLPGFQGDPHHRVPGRDPAGRGDVSGREDRTRHQPHGRLFSDDGANRRVRDGLNGATDRRSRFSEVGAGYLLALVDGTHDGHDRDPMAGAGVQAGKDGDAGKDENR